MPAIFPSKKNEKVNQSRDDDACVRMKERNVPEAKSAVATLEEGLSRERNFSAAQVDNRDH